MRNDRLNDPCVIRLVRKMTAAYDARVNFTQQSSYALVELRTGHSTVMILYDRNRKSFRIFKSTGTVRHALKLRASKLSIFPRVL
jgi:hypothetical protein